MRAIIEILMIILKLFIVFLLILLVIPYAEGEDDNDECFQIIHSAELELTINQINVACEEIALTGEAFIEDFRDRGLLIKFITLGESVSIPIILNNISEDEV